MTRESWDRIIGVNLTGAFDTVQAGLPDLLKAEDARVVFIASVASLRGVPYAAHYAASKHGLLGLMRSMAAEYAKSKMTVNAVCPGVIDTPMIERFIHGDPVAHAALGADQPMRRAGRPEEVASAVLWLSGEGASYVTGSALVVDGGWTAH